MRGPRTELERSTPALVRGSAVLQRQIYTGSRKIFLQAGQWIVAGGPLEITTILGSCVAVCLWDERLRVGGINHFMLPTGGVEGSVGEARYGDVAMKRLIDALRSVGSDVASLQAKIFGGAHTFERDGNDRRPHIGGQNVVRARGCLLSHNIEVIGHDVAGRTGRKLIYSLADGQAWVRRL